ncbi:ABC transporter permease [Desulfocurvibacter africanus]|uniref:ABC-2 type transporter n=1 Tax=Desulfocurvibacter africanus subsp. africanus str. Walvis Bay TaxID=690850 RepID=F3YVL3_DESAF|nr:ABC transporter permease [Desulfocurvibacter africanus]EGJ48749.1 ABC-2 type transporter [Desulfocurvibacter africanus subsp. africanus str. Walvis Bay]
MLASLHRVRALIIKEILALVRDKRSRIVLIAPPTIQLLVFSFAASLEVRNVSLAVFNQDTGAWSTELVQRFAGSRTFDDLRFLRGQQEIAEVMDSRKALVVVHIPQDFSRDIAAGRTGEVQVILDGRRSNSAQIVQGYIARILDSFNRDVAVRYGLPEPPSTLVVRNWFNPNLNNTWFTVPNLVGILSTVIGLVVTSLSVARERELGTFDQLLVTPLSTREILAGKTIPALILALLEGTLIVTVAVVGFRIPLHGSLLALYMSMAVFLSSIVGVGLFISSVAKTQQQAILGAFTFLVPAVALSGFATPVENMPEWLQYLSLGNPLRYFLVVVKGVFLKAMPVHMVWEQTWPMAVIAVANMAGAAWFFRRRLE